MKNKKNIIRINMLFFLTIILALGMVNTHFCESKSNPDLFNEIIYKTNAQVQEYGLITSFTTKKNPKEVCKTILKSIEPKVSYNEIVGKGLYCLEFNDKSIEGYVQSRNYDGQQIITINTICKSKENNCESLKNKVQNSIKEVEFQAKNKLFCYIKAEIYNENFPLVNEQVNKIVKEYNASNLKTIKINNGYSTCCYTGKYDPILVNGSLVDFNYSVCKYGFRNYLIIGTPQIILDY
ncbi:hypothetical protein [Clostridium sp. KNHs214]|uniref:hypothetical protein n=1 Tax=Clostridium sp. KNHs214 TaxID=1540257 RepID=UPI000551B6BE|nr:hypothetical protein [Clostridium sp. KNHs214]